MKATIYILHVVAGLLAASITSSPAWADTELARPSIPEAKEHLAAGNRLYRVREFEKAIDEYKAGALKEDVPLFGYNLAQCYRHLGRYEEAIWHYERFMSRAQPTGEMKTAIEGFLAQMKDELAKRATTKPLAEPAPAPEAKPAAPRLPEQLPRGEAIVLRDEPWYNDKVGWAVTAAGAIGAGVAVGLFVSANGLDDDANEVPDEPARRSLRDRASDRRVIGAIVGGVGVAALATGIVKLVMYPKHHKQGSTALDISVMHNGFALTKRF